MLRQATDLEKFELRALDGAIGRLQDFFFDDQRWRVRYFVIDTGSWINRGKVLISPASLSVPDWLERVLPIALTREQVERSPAIDTQQPVSREHEIALTHHYNWPVYWGVAGFPDVDFPGYDERAEGNRPGSARAVTDGAGAQGEAPGVEHDDPHLRSVRAVTGHAIEAIDGTVGHVADFLMDDLTWDIRYLLVDTRNWWPGKKVLIAPQWIDRVGWSEAKVHVKLTRDAIKNGPAYDPSQPITPDYAGQLVRRQKGQLRGDAAGR